MKRIILLFSIILTTVIITGCNPEDDTTSLWGPVTYDSTKHTITNVEIVNTGSEHIEGVTTLKITGTNFPNDYRNLKVWVSLTKAYLASIDPATYKTTEFYIKIPTVYDPLKDAERIDTLTIKLEKNGVPVYATSKLNGVKRGVIVPIKIADIDKPVNAITLDKSNNLYFCLKQNDASKGIFKGIIASNEYSQFLNFNGLFDGLKYGPGDTLYAVGLNYLVSCDGKNLTKINQLANINTANDLDFDDKLNVWVVTKTAKIIALVTRSSKYKNNVKFTINDADIYEMRSCKFVKLNNNAYLYVAGADKNGVEKIVRFKITNDVLDTTPEVIFTLSSGKIYSIALSKDGDIYVGTNGSIPLIWIKPDGTYENMLYYNNLTSTCVIQPDIIAIAYGIDKCIYVIRKTPDKQTYKQTIFKIYTGKDTAPYYGRGDN